MVGAVLAVAGIVGFFYSADFGRPGDTELVFGLLGVNGWHNLVHLLTGAVGIAVSTSVARARAYALVLGVVYVGLAIWGVVIGSGESILSVVPINGPDDLLHLFIGVFGLAVGVVPVRDTARTA